MSNELQKKFSTSCVPRGNWNWRKVINVSYSKKYWKWNNNHINSCWFEIWRKVIKLSYNNSQRRILQLNWYLPQSQVLNINASDIQINILLFYRLPEVKDWQQIHEPSTSKNQTLLFSFNKRCPFLLAFRPATIMNSLISWSLWVKSFHFQFGKWLRRLH